MEKKLYVYYYLNGKEIRHDFQFHSPWAAVFKARAIYEEHGIPTHVMDEETGELIAIFSPTQAWVSEEQNQFIKTIALQPLE